MTHKPRTPINANPGDAGLRAMGLAGPVAANHRQLPARVRMSGTHLVRLISKFLDLAKAEARQLAVAHEPATAGIVVATAISIVLPLAAAKGDRRIDAAVPRRRCHPSIRSRGPSARLSDGRGPIARRHRRDGRSGL